MKNRILRYLQFKFQVFSIVKHRMQNITSTPSPFSLSLYKALTPIHFLIRDARYVEYTGYNTRKHRMVRSQRDSHSNEAWVEEIRLVIDAYVAQSTQFPCNQMANSATPRRHRGSYVGGSFPRAVQFHMQIARYDLARRGSEIESILHQEGRILPRSEHGHPLNKLC